MSQINLDLSCPTSNKEIHYFKAVTDLVKNNKDLLSLLPYKYTRNQYRLKLVLTGSKNDLHSWLDLFLEIYPFVYAEVNAVKNKLVDGLEELILDNIGHVYPNGEVTDKWFYKK